MNANLYNGLTLAYIGDAIFEIYIRKEALAAGLTKVKEIHKFVTKRVNSEAQAKYIKYLLDNNFLTEEEKDIYLRGRNAHVKSNRKNVDLMIYHEATGFEALAGYLNLIGDDSRLYEIFEKVFREVEI